MSTALGHLLIALVVTVVVGLASGGDWAYFLMGAVLALSLWVMLFAGSYATPGRDPHAGRTSSLQYAAAAAVAVVLGYVMSMVGDGASWWAVGFILAGVIVPAGSAVTRETRSHEGA